MNFFAASAINLIVRAGLCFVFVVVNDYGFEGVSGEQRRLELAKHLYDKGLR